MCIALVTLFLAGPAWGDYATGPRAEGNTLRFEGRYEYRTDAESLEMLGEQVCFFPFEPSSRDVPRPPGDRRRPWFCFANSKQAVALLGLPMDAPSSGCGFAGSATITVSDYRRYTGEGDGNDVAALDDVLETSEPVSLPCAN